MAVRTKGYIADDDVADGAAPSVAEREEEAIARLMHRTDQILSFVVAALIICAGLIVLR